MNIVPIIPSASAIPKNSAKPSSDIYLSHEDFGSQV